MAARSPLCGELLISPESEDMPGCVWRITDFPRISNSPHTTPAAGEIGQRELGKQAVPFVQWPRVEPGHFPDHQSLSSGNATVTGILFPFSGTAFLQTPVSPRPAIAGSLHPLPRSLQ